MAPNADAASGFVRFAPESALHIAHGSSPRLSIDSHIDECGTAGGDGDVRRPAVRTRCREAVGDINGPRTFCAPCRLFTTRARRFRPRSTHLRRKKARSTALASSALNAATVFSAKRFHRTVMRSAPDRSGRRRDWCRPATGRRHGRARRPWPRPSALLTAAIRKAPLSSATTPAAQRRRPWRRRTAPGSDRRGR